MALPTDASMAENIVVKGGYKIRFSARATTDGSAVSGAKVSAVNITADVRSGAADESSVGPFLLVPGPST